VIQYAGQKGWSLVELAVGLVIAALLTILLLTALPIGNQLLDAERQQREINQAEQALLGYTYSHGYLPSAETDGGGSWLPVDELGLPSRMRIRYQVNPSLVAPPADDLFSPLLPPGDELATTINGLDFCMRLLLNQRDNVGMAGLGMPVAYYLAHSGMAGHHAPDAVAQWNEAAQPLPGEGDTAQVATVAAGPGELAARLACPDRMARAEGSAQTAYAAHSALRMTDFNLEFREFDINIAESSRDLAKVTRDLAIYALAEAITNEAIAITMMASGWPPDGVTIAAGIKQLAESVKSIVEASKSLASAEEAYSESLQTLAEKRNNRNIVSRFRDRIRTLYENARTTTTRLDAAGLIP